jgi:hypothetical protein
MFLKTCQARNFAVTEDEVYNSLFCKSQYFVSFNPCKEVRQISRLSFERDAGDTLPWYVILLFRFLKKVNI